MPHIGLILLLALLAACSSSNERDPGGTDLVPQPAPTVPPLLLISLDGFHPDYLLRGLTPSLQSLADSGVRARWMTPSFPSKTFPNHYTIVTGLVPDRHGIVENTMLDPELGRFSLGNRAAVGDARWWGGTPIWISAQRQGLRTATLFWPGSEAPIQGHHPDEWLPYRADKNAKSRIDRVLSWLDRDLDQRPHFVTLYLEQVDSVGHAHGPNSTELDQALIELDQTLADLIAGLRQRDLFDHVNLVIVSDHGMAELAPERSLTLEDILDPSLVEIVSLSEISTFNLKPGHEAEAEAALLIEHDGMRCARRGELPVRWDYGSHPRVPDIVCQLDEGWRMLRRDAFNPWQQQVRRNRGGHGFDPESESMRALFVAHGPAFRRGLVVEPFVNVHVYPLLAHLLDIEAADGDGDPQVTRPMLRP